MAAEGVKDGQAVVGVAGIPEGAQKVGRDRAEAEAEEKELAGQDSSPATGGRSTGDVKWHRWPGR